MQKTALDVRGVMTMRRKRRASGDCDLFGPLSVVKASRMPSSLRMEMTASLWFPLG